VLELQDFVEVAVVKDGHAPRDFPDGDPHRSSFLGVIPSNALASKEAIEEDVEELGNPKADEAGKGPRKAKRGQGEPQKEGKGKEPKAEVEETGEGAEEGVVGKAAVAEKPGIGPPKEPQGAPAPGRPAMTEIQIRRKEKASQKVPKPQGQELHPKSQGKASGQNEGKKAELPGEVGFSLGHAGILAGPAFPATLRPWPRARRITLAPKSPKC
jgi:hypothetical protein